MTDAESAIAERYRLLGPQLNERQRRAFAASEARTFGYGGIAAAARACGLAENTVRKGLRELDEQPLAPGRVRKPGAGRPAAEDSDPTLLEVLRELVEDDTRGDPEQVLLWTAKSARRLADELAERGHPVGFRTVPRLLRKLGYSLQSARKTLFLVSMLIAGCLAATAAATVALIWPNCASRSGCCLPSSVLRADCKL